MATNKKRIISANNGTNGNFTNLTVSPMPQTLVMFISTINPQFYCHVKLFSSRCCA